MTHAAIHITGLEVRAGSRMLLQIPELRVRQGERVAVVGPRVGYPYWGARGGQLAQMAWGAPRCAACAPTWAR